MSALESSLAARPAVPFDEDALVALGLATGLFSPEEADALLRASLRAVFDGSADPSCHVARVIDGPDGKPLGWTYISADSGGGPGVWELMWIGVTGEAQGTGVGKALLRDAEEIARSSGGRMLLICTSSTDATARARAFYEKQEYVQVGRIPEYYGKSDDKVIYWKAMA
jgi:ribosomal protein S18 acetylase RimI-like enzyme